MRSSLEADFSKGAKFGDQLPAMPDWATRRIFEKRNGLTLTPLPAGMVFRSVRSVLTTARRNSAPALPAVAVDDDPTGEKEKLRIRLEALKLL